MPPKTKITKEAIIDAAFIITKDFGIEAVTAQSVSKRLNCSTQPLYWAFENIESLKSAVTNQATKEYNKYLLTEIPTLNRFNAAGWNYIRFAKEQPCLFKLLFMTERQKDIDISNSTIDENKSYIISSIIELYGVSTEIANRIYINLWTLSHGIATMIVTKTVRLSDKEISMMLTDVMVGLIKNYKCEEQK